jgi:WD40 repeat protein/tetratricopeptide (TPR) repeat protein
MIFGGIRMRNAVAILVVFMFGMNSGTLGHARSAKQVPDKNQEQTRAWKDCAAELPNTAIPACTSIIQENDVPPEKLARAYVYRGSAYKSKGAFETAIADFGHAIELQPNLAEAFSERGNAYSILSKDDHAIADFDEAIRLQPDYATVYDNKGWTLYDKDFEAAQPNFDKTIEVTTKEIQLKHNLARNYQDRADAYCGKKDYERSIADFNQAIRLKPDYIEALRNRGATYFFKGDYEHALTDLNEVLRMQPDRYLGLYFRGYTYYLKRDYDLALKDFELAISLSPASANQYFARGSIHAAKHNYDLAISDYTEALRLEESKYTHANRGWAYINKGDPERALLDLNRALEMDPKLVDAHTGLAYIHNTQQQYDLALAQSNSALQTNPKYGYAYLLRGLTYKGKQENNAALADFSRAIEFDPKLSDAYFNRALLSVSTHQYQQAVDDVSAMIQLEPTRADPYQWRAAVIMLMRDGKDDNAKIDRAIADLNEALRLQPNHRGALTDRSAGYLAKGDTRSALADLDQIVRYYPDDPTAYAKRAQFHSDQHQYISAINDLTDALRVKPGDADTLFERARIYGLNSNSFGQIGDLTEIISKGEDFEKKYDAYYQRAETYDYMSKTALAMADLNEIIHGYSTNIKADLKNKAYLRRGQLYKNQGNFDAAIADFNEAIRLVPGDFETHKMRAWTQVQFARYDDAIANLTEFLKSQPNEWAYGERGWARWKNGDYDQAIADFSEGIRLKPADMETIAIRNIVQEARQVRLASSQGKLDLATTPVIGSSDRISTFAVSADGTRMVMGGIGRVTVWDVTSGKLLRVLDNDCSINSVVFSPDGAQIVTGRWDGLIQAWDVATGKPLRTINAAMTLSSLAFSPNGSELIVGGADGLKLWDANGQSIPFSGRSRGVKSVVSSPDGAFILSGNDDATIELSERASGKVVRTFSGHADAVTSVAFSPDGANVLSGSDDRTMRVWETATGKQTQVYRDTSRRISAVAFSRDGNRLLVQMDGDVELWDAKQWQKQQVFHDQRAAAFSPDGTNILTISSMNAELRDAATGKTVRNFGGRVQNVHTVILSRDKTRLFTASDAFRLWDTKLAQLTLAGAAKLDPVAYSPATDALSGSLDSVATIFTRVQRFTKETPNAKRATVSPDGAYVFTYGGTSTYAYGVLGTLWDMNYAYSLRELHTHSNRISAAVFSSNGKLIVTGGNDGSSYEDQFSIKLTDAATGNPVKTFENIRSEVTTLSISSDGARLVSGHHDGTITMWDVASGKELWFRAHSESEYHGHKTGFIDSAAVETVAFSPDGRWVISSGHGKVARLWDAQSGELVRMFVGHSDDINVAVFSQDGSQVVTGGSDGKVIIWDTASGARLVTFWGAVGGEWLAMTPEGFFKSSPNGAELFSVQLGTEHYSLTQFRERLQRPDLVEELLKGDPKEKYKDAVLVLNTQSLLKP